MHKMCVLQVHIHTHKPIYPMCCFRSECVNISFQAHRLVEYCAFHHTKDCIERFEGAFSLFQTITNVASCCCFCCLTPPLNPPHPPFSVHNSLQSQRNAKERKISSGKHFECDNNDRAKKTNSSTWLLFFSRQSFICSQCPT